VDYITKPFNPSLVRARIANHIALEKARKKLKVYGEQLEELVQERTRQLADAHEQLKAIDETKNEFLAAISHELRTPANGILGIGSLAIDSMAPCAEKEEMQGFFEQSCRRLTDMLDSAMYLARLQSGDTPLTLEPIELEETVRRAVENLEISSNNRLFAIRNLPVCQIQADRQFLLQSIQTLLAAAEKLNSAENPVLISGKADAARVVVSITSSGQTVPEELMKTMFEAFSAERSASYIEDLGLKLPVAEKMIRAMQGRVRVENTDDPGFIIRIDLPKL